MDINSYLNAISERTVENRAQMQRTVTQRRNGMEDLYGVPFSAQGDNNSPATFYISLSPDCVYIERFAFKFVIRPFTTTVTGGTTSATVAVNDRSLSVSDGNISPNPHDHTTNPHTHNVINGVSFINTTSTSWKIKIHGIDITPYLIEQQNGNWINGEGIYPNNSLQGMENFYDILDVASVLEAEGRTSDREKLLAPEFKKVEIISDAPFGVDAYLYMKLSHTNR